MINNTLIELKKLLNSMEKDFGLNSFSLGFKSSNNTLEIFLSVFSFSDFDQKAEFEFKEQLKIKINII